MLTKMVPETTTAPEWWADGKPALTPLDNEGDQMVDQALASHERNVRAVSRLLGSGSEHVGRRAILHESWRQARSLRERLRQVDPPRGAA